MLQRSFADHLHRQWFAWIRRPKQGRGFRRRMGGTRIWEDALQKYIFSFVITCEICNIVIEPKQYINYKKCCLNVCTSCRNFYAVKRNCTLCKEDMWIDGFPTGMCGCHYGLLVCGNCTNRETFHLYDKFINDDYESNDIDKHWWKSFLFSCIG